MVCVHYALLRRREETTRIQLSELVVCVEHIQRTGMDARTGDAQTGDRRQGDWATGQHERGLPLSTLVL